MSVPNNYQTLTNSKHYQTANIIKHQTIIKHLTTYECNQQLSNNCRVFGVKSCHNNKTRAGDGLATRLGVQGALHLRAA